VSESGRILMLKKSAFLCLQQLPPAVLDYIDVDTICIPEPATIVMLGLGALMSLLRRKK
jgi:hypothetical protein